MVLFPLVGRATSEERVVVRRLVVMGAGGHAREVLDVLESLPEGTAWERVTVFAEPGATTPGAAALIWQRGHELVDVLPTDATHHLPAVGDPALRRRFAELAERHGLLPAGAVSPSSTVPEALRGVPGLVVFPRSHVSTNVTLGAHCHLNTGCQVSHDGRLGDRVTLGPGVLVAGGVTIEDDAFLGIGAVVLPGRRIGRAAVVGAGAVVVHDVAPGTTVAGNPARPLGLR
ncbi:acetyltransferase [Modestobacter sp. VKM Ac-2986]|uniref:acetyltransferase n=1 Tax=Modestobacter sp. VKM Ac-2986 TaxID=3004140 RepID=UPI0022AB4FDE|nr:acetyltransferase [Modestobacter sp. VKM Ac-2986]MCZ2830306.1 acetyltransferase [Modestobacter sp. VKM Ac-2986]